jgi:heme exporter protein B
MTPFAALLRKDLRVELRTLRSLPAMALFAVTAFVIFRFGLDRTSLNGELAAGVLIPTLLFAALLAINRLFVPEREEGGFDLVRLAPVDRTVLFAAKASALVIYLVVLDLVAVPIFALFFLDSASGLLPNRFSFEGFPRVPRAAPWARASEARSAGRDGGARRHPSR